MNTKLKDQLLRTKPCSVCEEEHFIIDSNEKDECAKCRFIKIISELENPSKENPKTTIQFPKLRRY